MTTAAKATASSATMIDKRPRWSHETRSPSIAPWVWWSRLLECHAAVQSGGQHGTKVTNALGMGVSQRRMHGETIIHSDQGTQSTSWAFTRRALVSGLLPSMGSVGGNIPFQRGGFDARDSSRNADCSYRPSFRVV